MDRRDKVPGVGLRHDAQPGEAKPAGRMKPREVGKARKGSAGSPGRDDTAQPAEARKPESSEDFGGRRDIETADESSEQHDRRHHDRDRGDVEAGRPL